MIPRRPRALTLTALAGLAIALVLLAVPVSGARPSAIQAQAPEGQIAGELTEGGFALVAWGGGTPSALVAAADARGCEVVSVWVADGGTLRGYIAGAPAVVNREFLGLFEGDTMPAMPIIVVCDHAAGIGTPGTRAIEGTSCTLFPDDNPWAQRVDSLPVHPSSDAYMAYLSALSGNRFLHADFGEDPTYGIPWVVVPPDQPCVPVTFDYDDESDAGPYPIPSDAPVEAGGDRHILVVQDRDCLLYELFAAERSSAGWHAGSGAIFDLKSNALRPDGWTSADAAGLPIFAGLARFEEVRSGRIEHALRVTFSRTQRAYIHPATHYASSITNLAAPPMGLRLRLRADFDLDGYEGDARVILEALRDYGMIVADNGSNWYISGATDPRWDDDDLNQLKSVPGSAFEVVYTGDITGR